MSTTEVVCLFPLKMPFLLWSASSDELTCPPRKNEVPLPAGTIGYGWTGSVSGGPADFGIDPVRVAPVALWDWGSTTSPDFRPQVCPGTPLAVTVLRESEHVQIHLNITGVHLAQYQLNDVAAGGTSIGVVWP